MLCHDGSNPGTVTPRQSHSGNCLRTSGPLPGQAATLTAQLGHPMTWPSAGKPVVAVQMADIDCCMAAEDTGQILSER